MRVDALPVADVALLVGAVSDNWATNALIDLCGLDRIQAKAAALAPGGSMLHDYVRDDRSGAVPETLSRGCAQDWAAIMQRLYDADGIDARCLPPRAGLAGSRRRPVDGRGGVRPRPARPRHRRSRAPPVAQDRNRSAECAPTSEWSVRASAVVSYAVLCNWPATDTRAQTRQAVLSTMRRIGDEIRSCVAPAGA